MLKLLKDACDSVTSDNWKKDIDRTRKIMEDDWERDVRFDQSTQELIINLQDCSSESESDFDDSDLVCEPI